MRLGAREGHLRELFGRAELRDVHESSLEVTVHHASFDAWWDPFMLGVGPGGAYLTGLAEERQVEVRERCRQALGSGPLVISARAWTARALA